MLEKKLKDYEERLAKEMKGYRGVIHESAASEVKHTNVMILKDMIKNLKIEIEKSKNARKK